jgi:glutathionyl-hydroquinone reductase
MAQQLTHDESGAFIRGESRFKQRITADGSSPWPVEPGRYRLSSATPARGPTARSSCAACSGWRTQSRWASPTPSRTSGSWRFTLDPDDRDPVLGIRFLSEAYKAATPATTGASASRPSSTSRPERS